MEPQSTPEETIELERRRRRYARLIDFDLQQEQHRLRYARRHKVELKQTRVLLLFILLWAGCVIELLTSISSVPWHWLSLVTAAAFVALACAVYLGGYAYLAVTEGRKIDRVEVRNSLLLLLLGVGASGVLGNGSAAFLMLILTGFSLNWWGVAMVDSE